MSSVAAADDVVTAAPMAVAAATEPDTTPFVAPAAQPVVDTTVPYHAPRYGQEGQTDIGVTTGFAHGKSSNGANLGVSASRFIGDGFALSGIVDVAHLRAGGNGSTVVAALIEPSLHIEMKPDVYGFVGIGAGPSYVPDLGMSIAVQPHIGADFLVGRKGIVRPSLSYLYTMHDPNDARGPNGTTSVTYTAVTSAVRLDVGYSTYW